MLAGSGDTRAVWRIVRTWCNDIQRERGGEGERERGERERERERGGKKSRLNET